MSPRIHRPLRVAAVAAAATLTGLSFAPAALAADGDVQVVNTETVQVYTDATGAVQTKRVYEQVAMTGSGTVDLSNPIETDGLRNLDGFGGFDVENGNQVAEISVDGEQRLRTVSDYDGDLPLEVEVQYFLNDKRVEPGDVVGATGKLGVQYAVKNVTSAPQEVTFSDGSGGEVTKTIDVPIPMVGSLTTTAPSNFTDVQSEQANIAGDGKGGTKLSFTMTLFPPLGSDTAEFGYTAHIVDGVVPRADISALPVNPLASPTFKTAADSYQGGATTGETLADGADQIDTNLLKLRDGAGDLLAGLIQLRDGSSQLQVGLAGEAAPGAAKLADGAGQLDAGLGQINSGARRLADGTGEAFAGSQDLADGASKIRNGLVSAQRKAPALITGLGDLRDGLVAVDKGLATMYNSVGSIPSSAKPIFDGLDQLIAGIGKADEPATLLYGVNAVRAGLTAALPKIQQMADGVFKEDATNPGAYQKLGCAVRVMSAVRAGTLPPGPGMAGDTDPCFKSASNISGQIPPLLPLASVDPSDGLTPDEYRTVAIGNVIDGLVDGRTKLATSTGAMNETTLYGGLLTLKEQLQHFPTSAADTPGAITALASVQCGLDNTSLEGVTLPNGLPASTVCKKYTSGPSAGQKQPGLKQGLVALNGGVDTLVTQVVAAVQGGIGRASDTPGTTPATLRGGMTGLIDGVDLISAGGGTLIDGLGLLADGSRELAAGAGDLSDGLGKIDDGAGQLADGTGEAKDGSGQLADGAGRLADGLGDAADGSTRLTEGLTTAADGAPKLVDGAERLSNEGTKKLVEAGEDTAQNYGELYATIEAGSERAQAEKMAYGAPQGAMGLTAYSFVIEGENGEGGRNLARGVAGLAILGAGAGAFAFRRRLI